MSVDRISYARPSIQSRAFVTIAIADDQTPTVIDPNTGIDLGIVAGGGNGDTQMLTFGFNSDFDDSVFEDIRAFVLNMPPTLVDAGHVIEIDFAPDLAWLVAQNTLFASAVPVVGNPDAAFKEPSASAYQGAGGTPAQKQIGTIALQLNPGSPAAWNWANEYLVSPTLAVEFQRKDSATTKLRVDYSNLDFVQGQLFTFSEVELYEVLTDTSGSDWWQLQGAITDESFDLNLTTEVIEWMKGKPGVTFHQALSTIITEAKFNLFEDDPRWMSRSLDITPTENTTDNTIDISLDGRTRPVVYGHYVIQWFTQGGFRVMLDIPKGNLTPTGSTVPGGAEFAGKEYTIKALGAGAQTKNISNLRCTRTPVEQILVPMTYGIT